MSTERQQKTKDRESLKVSLEVLKWVKKRQAEAFDRTGKTPKASLLLEDLIRREGAAISKESGGDKVGKSPSKELQSHNDRSNIALPQPVEVQKLLFILKHKDTKEARGLWNALDFAYTELGGPEVKPSAPHQAQAHSGREPAGTRSDK